VLHIVTRDPHITLLVVSGCNYHRWPAMMEFFLSGSLPLIVFVICDVMSDMANKLLSLSLSTNRWQASELCISKLSRSDANLLLSGYQVTRESLKIIV